ncbi:hypothetical protein ebA6843 [Aromatoleum aromaticum EbN1]|uniref:Uncharacterized protein n=1 Tax=Aromatoleum aromaticum (strain DSM 19018 / LMG 30748 / EbN1) TaxID=76114 RepID=Q5NY29_AROAE|nr:hypothetical protein ebA6843 [Aromatoleum aromaticum EbN1]
MGIRDPVVSSTRIGPTRRPVIMRLDNPIARPSSGHHDSGVRCRLYRQLGKSACCFFNSFKPCDLTQGGRGCKYRKACT